MSRLEALSALLNALNREIEEIADQRIILSLTHPLAFEHRRLECQREAVEAELRKLRSNVVSLDVHRRAASKQRVMA